MSSTITTGGESNRHISECNFPISVVANSNTPVIHIETKPLSEFKDEPNAQAKPSQGLYIRSSFGNACSALSFKLLIDSGAAMSLLDSTTYGQIPADIRPPVKECFKQIRLVDGSVADCEGIVSMDIEIGGTVKTIDFLLGKYSDEAILGMKDLQALGLTINFDKMLVTAGNSWVPVVDSQNKVVGRKVVVRRSIVVPSRSQMLIQAEVDGLCLKTFNSPCSLMLQPSSSVLNDFGIVPAKSLHSKIENTIPVLLYNPNNEDIIIGPDVVLGSLDEVEVVIEEESETSKCSKVTFSTNGNKKILPEHVCDLFERSSEHLNPQESSQLFNFLCEYGDVFSKGDFDIGHSSLVEHKIDVGNANPIKQHPRRLGPEARIAADELIEGLLEKKLISPSQSPWASPIVMAKKKDGSHRLCLDFRSLNALTKKDAYPLPRIDDTLESIGGAKWFCTADLASGYWQIKMDEASKEKNGILHKDRFV